MMNSNIQGQISFLQHSCQVVHQGAAKLLEARNTFSRSALYDSFDSFAIRVVNPWNKLPLDVVMAPNLNSFKSRLNVHYKNFPLKLCPSFMSAR